MGKSEVLQVTSQVKSSQVICYLENGQVKSSDVKPQIILLTFNIPIVYELKR